LALTAALPTSPELQSVWATTYGPQMALLEGLTAAQPWQFRVPLQPVVDQMNTGIQQIYGGFLLASHVLTEAEAVGNKQLQP
ncbi:MAG: hypothetical protein KF832_30305, partial [Caldilineaceae bacterium]|nr:hypothetical protein [Caldilineaceae bacterium]